MPRQPTNPTRIAMLFARFPRGFPSGVPAARRDEAEATPTGQVVVLVPIVAAPDPRRPAAAAPARSGESRADTRVTWRIGRNASTDQRACCSAATTASPIAAVPTTASPGSAMSPVRMPCAQHRRAPPPRCGRRGRRGRRCSGTSSPATGSSPADWPCPCPAMSGAEPWIGSYRPLPRGVERRRRQHADRARQHRRLVGQDVAEDVAGDDHVELLRVAHQLHRRVVDVHVRQRDVRILRAPSVTTSRHRMRRVEHVGLVDRAQRACRAGARSRSRRARCARSRARCRASCRSPRRRRRRCVRRPRGWPK